LHDDRSKIAHFLMKQANGVVFRIIGPEAVGTDEFRKAFGLVRRGHLARTAHFGQSYAHPALGELPCRFAASKAATDNLDVKIFVHVSAANKNLWRCTGKSAKMGYGIYA
jgi:hypothetical protein